ncbi:MAG TPA: hypothetical protein VM290_01030 [Gaiellaceae bacterium]|nr:hypothetical protein [Gaiellaceae bacterium]
MEAGNGPRSAEEEYGRLGTAGPIEETRGPVLLPAILAGVAAAVVGGIVWGLIVRFSEYELGIIAWGVGLLAGMAVAFAARGARGPVLAAVAVASALLGILIGKYLSFAWVVQDIAEEDGVSLGVFSGETFSLFRENLGTVFSGFDLLWVGLAVFTAWRLLRPEEEAEEEAPAEA